MDLMAHYQLDPLLCGGSRSYVGHRIDGHNKVPVERGLWATGSITPDTAHAEQTPTLPSNSQAAFPVPWIRFSTRFRPVCLLLGSHIRVAYPESLRDRATLCRESKTQSPECHAICCLALAALRDSRGWAFSIHSSLKRPLPFCWAGGR